MSNRLLEGEEIGDNLFLEEEGVYPCSDGSSTMTISVGKLLIAQDAKTAEIVLKEVMGLAEYYICPPYANKFLEEIEALKER